MFFDIAKSDFKPFSWVGDSNIFIHIKGTSKYKILELLIQCMHLNVLCLVEYTVCVFLRSPIYYNILKYFMFYLLNSIYFNIPTGLILV
jgi:hypothetical protein